MAQSTALKQRRSRLSNPPKLEEGAASRQLILDAAASLFCSQGYGDTSMREIADKVGIKQASIYYHFPSKEVILTEILSISIDTVVEAVSKRINELPQNTRPGPKLLLALESHVRALYERPDYTATAVRCAAEIPKKTLREALPKRGKYAAFWRGLFKDAAASKQIAPGIDVELLHPFLLHSVNRTLAWYNPARGNVEDLIQIVLKIAASFVVQDKK